jgi:glycosyltransferase involved in cell wall biosynthesis
VIASALGGLPEAVGDGGLLVDPATGVEGWLDAIALIWDDAAAYARFASLAELNGRRLDAATAEIADRFETLLRHSISAAA